VDEIFSIISRSAGAAGIYILIGLGYNAIFSTTRVFNLAQGELSVIGAYLGLWLMNSFGVPIVLALLIVAMLVGLLAVIEEVIAVRPVLRGEAGSAATEHNIAWAITTLAVGVLLSSSAEIIALPDPLPFPSLIPARSVEIGSTIVNLPAVGLFVVALLTAVALHLFYTRSLTGKAMTAMAEDTEAANLRGINTNLLKTLSFALAGLIAGVAAFFIAPLTYVFPSLGAIYSFKGFIAIAIGGMGNNAGALLGGVLLALVEVLGADFLGAAYRDTVSITFLLLVLLVFPRGILGHRFERKV
jgi:branched-chain amino acid transport system permease protein